jgi:hypothetical protein
MTNLLTATDLIARLTPTALAEAIASIQQADNLDATEQNTVAYLRDVLTFNVGEDEAGALVEAAHKAA